MGMVLLLSCSSSKNCTIIICHFLSRIMQDHERENEKKKALTFRSLAHCISVIGSFVHWPERRKRNWFNEHFAQCLKNPQKVSFLQHMRAAKLSFLFGFSKSPPIQQLTCQKLAPF